MSKLTLKFQNFSNLSISNKSEDNINEFSGYASVYNKIDHHNDIIVKGAFDESIQDINSIKLLWQHKHDCPIGKIISINEDEYGLHITGEILNNIKHGQEASNLIKNQIINGLSIGCLIQESKYNDNGVRIITKANLKEISIVTFPANDQAIIDMKNTINIKQEEEMLNKNYFDNSQDINYQRIDNKSNDLERMTEFIKSSGVSSIEIKSLNSFYENDGGVLIGRTINNQIISNIETKSPLRKIASVEQISGSYIDFVIENGEFESGWVAELSERPDTGSSKLVQKRIQVHELYAQPKATNKLIEDSEINFNNWLIEQISDSFIKKENESFISGDGENKPKGILNNTEVKIIKSQEEGKILIKDILNLINSLDENYIGNASFLMNRSTLADIQNFQDNNGRFIWQKSISTEMNDTLFGIPVYCCSYMPNLEKGKLPIIFGDFRSGYKILDRKNIYITKDPYTDKPFIKFYAVKRVGADVLDSKALKILKV
jgi:hypothetical protein